jgi:eukaryotic-like serine/threonine-protein kinase
MTLAAGTRLGPYEIIGAIGAGGMGEVYKARDTRLERTVAVKVLPGHLSSNPALRQRFEREAKAVSSLSHPNICPLYDVGHQDGVDYLVMEYLEGETLASRLERGPLPVEDVLRRASEIADAMDRAHRQGVIHRDLKPGNIMLTKNGARLLDFGLAKSAAPAASVTALTSAATATSPLTAEGTVVGTFHYMAPEQLEGKEADARSDIFSFGAVIHEMATGRKAFEGKTQASVIAAVLERQPPTISSLQPLAPPALDRVVRLCLAKDPDERRQTMHDVLLDLKWITASASQSGGTQPASGSQSASGVQSAPGAQESPLPVRPSRERLAWIVAAMALVAAVALGALFLRRPAPEAPRRLRASLLPPEGAQFDFAQGPMALSPDGTRLAFVARRKDDRESLLWLRPLDGDRPVPLQGTEGASFPFWSPDGRHVAFFAHDKLRRIEVSGSVLDTLCDAGDPLGGSWGPDGTILFARRRGMSIQKVAAIGGTPAAATSFHAGAAEAAQIYPSFLPDGRHFLYSSFDFGGARSGINIASLDGGDPVRLLESGSQAIYATPGYLLFWRDGALRAQRFDPARLRLEGEAVPVAPDARFDVSLGAVFAAVDGEGLLVYRVNEGNAERSRLVWLDREGREVGTLGAAGNYYVPHISHSGRSMALDVSDPQSNMGDIWIYDIARGSGSRLTYNPENETQPVWSPDDSRIVFQSSRRRVRSDLFIKPVTGTVDDKPLYVSESGSRPTDWSPDGRLIVFESFREDSGQGRDLWLLEMPEAKARPLLATQFEERAARFSPDGRWLAYVSNESGRPEVFVRPFPAMDRKWQISTDGGGAPRWRGDGREIVFVASDGEMSAVDVNPGTEFEIGAAHRLFATRLRDMFTAEYDMTPDGQRFLLAVTLGEASSGPLTLVTNWTSGIGR